VANRPYRKVNYQDNYFQRNSWSFDFESHVTAEYRIREITNTPPKRFLIVGEIPADFEQYIPVTDLDTFRVDVSHLYNPSLFAWPVAGVPTAIVNCGVFGLTFINLATEYQAPEIEVYEIIDDTLLRTHTYPEMDGKLKAA